MYIQRTGVTLFLR